MVWTEETSGSGLFCNQNNSLRLAKGFDQTMLAFFSKSLIIQKKKNYSTESSSVFILNFMRILLHKIAVNLSCFYLMWQN